MHVTGVLWIPFLIGAIICLLSGLCAGIFIVACLIDWYAQKHKLVHEFYLFLVDKRRKKREVPSPPQ